MSGSGVSSVDSSSESSDGETTDDVTTTEDTRPSASHQLMGVNRALESMDRMGRRLNVSEQDSGAGRKK